MATDFIRHNVPITLQLFYPQVCFLFATIPQHILGFVLYDMLILDAYFLIYFVALTIKYPVCVRYRNLSVNNSVCFLNQSFLVLLFAINRFQLNFFDFPYCKRKVLLFTLQVFPITQTRQINTTIDYTVLEIDIQTCILSLIVETLTSTISESM